MRARANTRVTILRGTEVDGYGDEVDSDVAVYTGVPALIMESTRRTYLPAENAYRVIRAYSGRVGYETDLRKDDRIRDEATGVVFLVTELSEPRMLLGFKPDRVVQLSRTT